MNKTLLLAGVVTALFASNVNAMDFNPYVGAKLRYIDMSSDVKLGDTFDVDDNVYGGSIAIGASTKVKGGAVRAELEYNKNADADKTHRMTLSGTGFDFDGKLEIESQSLMLNAYYDIDTGTKFTPYVGAGVGYAKIEGTLSESTTGLSESVDDNNFAWQVGAGVGYAVNENVSVDAGYRYVDYGDFTKEDVNIDVSSHEFYLGARYAF